MKKSIQKTVTLITATLMMIILQGCSQFETPLEIPETGTIQVITTPDSKCTLYRSTNLIMEWTGSKVIPGLVFGNYKVNIKVNPLLPDYETNIIISEQQTNVVEPQFGSFTIITKSDYQNTLFLEGIEQFSWMGSKVFNQCFSGNYILKTKMFPGVAPAEQNFTIQPNETKTISWGWGNLIVTTLPLANCTLKQDGNTLTSWQGSKTLDSLIIGNYTLIIEASGYTSQTEVITLSNGQTLKKNVQLLPFSPMIYIATGTFLMGCTSEQTDCHSNETPKHQVTLSAYEIGKYEVTQIEWRTVMGTSPSHFTGDNKPVERVSWDDIMTFCNILSTREGLTPVYALNGSTVTANWSANGYRLPTEAEWEYAARGGALSTNTLYSGSNTLEDVGWYNSNSGNTTHDVGTKQPNELGIYDMTGNVWEWCWDWYEGYYSDSQANPTGPTYGSYRVLRGGGWSNDPGYCRVAKRSIDDPDSRYYSSGFRLVRTR